jgi:hypothetical protein
MQVGSRRWYFGTKSSSFNTNVFLYLSLQSIGLVSQRSRLRFASVLDIHNNKTSVLIHCVYTRNASKHHKCYERTNYIEHTLSNKGVDVYEIR